MQTQSASTTLLERNHKSLADFVEKPMDITLGAIILTCMDPRVHPAEALGLHSGEAVVIRNPGGRVTPDFARSMAILSIVAQQEQPEGETQEPLGAGLEIILIQHTDCGLSRLDNPESAQVASDYLGVPASNLADHSLADPYRGIMVDMQKLQQHPAIPDDLKISGFVLDITTGTLNPVVPGGPQQ